MAENQYNIGLNEFFKEKSLEKDDFLTQLIRAENISVNQQKPHLPQFCSVLAVPHKRGVDFLSQVNSVEEYKALNLAIVGGVSDKSFKLVFGDLKKQYSTT
jgi:hypothetical protein